MLRRSCCYCRRALQIDLRHESTLPASKALWDACVDAKVGDDVWDEDVTIKELQRRFASMCGKQAAIFMPTHRMANCAATIAHHRPPHAAAAAVVVGNFGCPVVLAASDSKFAQSDIVESVSPSAIKLIPCERNLAQFQHFFDNKRGDVLFIALENTVSSSGRVLDANVVSELRKKLANVATTPPLLHCDGARLFHAAAKVNAPLSVLLADFDSAAISPKALGVGSGMSVLVGSEEFIASAARARKVLGGGMRQIGVFGAGFLHALDDDDKLMMQQPREDNERASRLASVFKERGWAAECETNIVLASKPNVVASDFVTELASKHGILLRAHGVDGVRAVVHHKISDNSIDAIAKVL